MEGPIRMTSREARPESRDGAAPRAAVGVRPRVAVAAPCPGNSADVWGHWPGLPRTIATATWKRQRRPQSVASPRPFGLGSERLAPSSRNALVRRPRCLCTNRARSRCVAPRHARHDGGLADHHDPVPLRRVAGGERAQVRCSMRLFSVCLARTSAARVERLRSLSADLARQGPRSLDLSDPTMVT